MKKIMPDKDGFYFGELRRARKKYTCRFCGEVINPGDEYVFRKPFWSSKVERICLKHIVKSG